MNKFISPVLKNILLVFFSWRILLIIISMIAVKALPLAYTDRFLGGGSINYQIIPQFFSWANFDGEHYLSIATYGYKGLEQAFFPVYPMLISFFAKPLSTTTLSLIINSVLAGLLISNISFILALFFLWKLVRLDFSKRIATLTILLLTFFPTSFYFGAVYTESIFLLFTILSFLAARKKKWFIASLFGMIASATRIFGVLIFPALIIDAYLQKEKMSKVYWLILIPLGLGTYMLYQYLTIGDGLAFYHIQSLVGEQRQSQLVILPQVYYRYLKMLSTINLNNYIYQTVLIEFVAGITFFILPIFGYFKKIRLSYLFYAFIGFLITTVQGSFSSVPRYVLVFFPSFIALALWLDNLPKLAKAVVFLIFILLLIIESSLFLRGYWVA